MLVMVNFIPKLQKTSWLHRDLVYLTWRDWALDIRVWRLQLCMYVGAPYRIFITRVNSALRGSGESIRL